jgi:hypothetical protein
MMRIIVSSLLLTGDTVTAIMTRAVVWHFVPPHRSPFQHHHCRFAIAVSGRKIKCGPKSKDIASGYYNFK